mgnify:CR=1 FL=1
MTYIDETKKNRTFRFDLLEKYGCSQEIASRLTYAYDKVHIFKLLLSRVYLKTGKCFIDRMGFFLLHIGRIEKFPTVLIRTIFLNWQPRIRQPRIISLANCILYYMAKYKNMQDCTSLSTEALAVLIHARMYFFFVLKTYTHIP